MTALPSVSSASGLGQSQWWSAHPLRCFQLPGWPRLGQTPWPPAPQGSPWWSCCPGYSHPAWRWSLAASQARRRVDGHCVWWAALGWGDHCGITEELRARRQCVWTVTGLEPWLRWPLEYCPWKMTDPLAWWWWVRWLWTEAGGQEEKGSRTVVEAGRWAGAFGRLRSASQASVPHFELSGISAQILGLLLLFFQLTFQV